MLSSHFHRGSSHCKRTQGPWRSTPFGSLGPSSLEAPWQSEARGPLARSIVQPRRHGAQRDKVEDVVYRDDVLEVCCCLLSVDAIKPLSFLMS